ncbi:transmembrane protein [Ceratobasidium sp. AG-Ba]|nr:transmembrane protein [Ceratobasidium sp. AG-Ba]
MLPYLVIAILMFVGRVAYFREDRACVIGLQKYASISLLTYDLYINVFLTGMFLWPLFGSRLTNPRIRAMALRTLVAAGAALTTSTANIAVLTVMHGQQLGWVCLGSCGSDATLNALALFWVTSYGSPPSEGSPPGEAPIADHEHEPSGRSSVLPEEYTLARRTPPVSFVAQYSTLIRGILPDVFGVNRPSNVSSGQPEVENGIPAKDMRSERYGESDGIQRWGLLKRIGDALRYAKNSSPGENYQTNLQVTVTTEQHEVRNEKRISTASSMDKTIRVSEPYKNKWDTSGL